MSHDEEQNAIDDAYCERLVCRILDGDPDAHAELVSYLWPHWIRLARTSRSLGRLACSEDHVMDVVMRVAEKLQRPDHHHLALYATWKASNEGKAFGDWMRIVLRNVARDVARAQLGPRRNEGDQPSVKRLLNELSSHVEVAALGTRPPYTDAQTARELLSFAGQKLTPPQLEALVGWVRGASFEELAQPLGVDAAAARNLVRAAIATLRRRFAP